MIAKVQWQSANCHYFVLQSKPLIFLLSYDCTTVQKRLGPSTHILSNDSTVQESVLSLVERLAEGINFCCTVWSYNEKKLDGLGLSSKEST